MPKPKIYSTAEWNAREPKRTGFSRHAAKGIVVHNTEHENRAPKQGAEEAQKAFSIARSIQKHHLDENGWSDSGQHFTISRGGVIMEGRHGSLSAAEAGEVVRGAHASGVRRYNEKWFGIELEGDYRRVYDVTPEQWQSLVELCAWLSAQGKFGADQIIGHREVANATDCPGLMLEHISELREAVHMRREQIERE